ncbi:MAG: ABC transporter substrate-binding protein [Syntrophobacteraceae bacterium]
MTIRFRIIAVVCLATCVLWMASTPATCGEPISRDKRYFSFVPAWTPQAQFAGYYVAYEKGFYREQGLEINIMRGGPERPATQWIKKGAADFGIMFLTTGIQERANGTDMVNIGQVIAKSSQLLVAKRSSGIDTYKKMDGKKVGVWGDEFNILPAALFRKYGLHVTTVPQSSTVNLFLRGGVDVASAMWYNEYHSILNAGVEPEELVVFRLAENGVNFPEDGIYCLESTWKKDPEGCCRFVQASLKGWRYAFEHREEALDIVMKYVNETNVPTNRVHQKWMLDRLSEVIDLSGSTALLQENDFLAVARELEELGMINGIPAYSDFFVNCAAAHEK